jgi:hypothetical protein
MCSQSSDSEGVVYSDISALRGLRKTVLTLAEVMGFNGRLQNAV